MEKKFDNKKVDDLRNNYKTAEMSSEAFEKMKDQILQAKKDKRAAAKLCIPRSLTAAAAALAILVAVPNISPNAAYAMSTIPVIGNLIKVVTFRNYKYESTQHTADISIPELITDHDSSETGVSSSVQENLKKSTDEINAEIQNISEQILADFNDSLKAQEGYQDAVVTSEIINTTDQYFTLKLICFQAAASGNESDYFYTIDLTTGKRLMLKDLFSEGADYITPISENIKEQMRAQMEADPNVHYWLDEEIEDCNFKSITDQTSFYINETGQLVIVFNEYDAAPGYMGVVSFEIPNEVTADIRIH